MANESGDMNLLGNFSKLIELISTDPDYNPATTTLKMPALNAQKTTALAAVADIGTQQGPYKAALNDREYGFEGLRPVVGRSLNVLRASGVSQKIRDDARRVARKIVRRPKTSRVKDDPDTPQSEAAKSHSASRLSYENILANVDDYIAMLATTATTYAPNETSLTIAGLTALVNDLKGKNETVNTTFAPVNGARGRRDQLLYLNADCVVNIALLVKAHVRAGFGPDSQLFKSIRGLTFERPGKKLKT